MVKVTSAKTAALIGAAGSTEVIIGAVPAAVGAAVGILCVGGVAYGVYKCVKDTLCPQDRVAPYTSPVQLSHLSQQETNELNRHLSNHIAAAQTLRANAIDRH
jgi:hypothetical protein